MKLHSVLAAALMAGCVWADDPCPMNPNIRGQAAEWSAASVLKTLGK